MKLVKNTGLHAEIIVNLVKWVGAERYLELGVDGGGTARRVCFETKAKVFAVDKREVGKVPGVEYFIKTTKDFFAEDARDIAPFDFVFIDADHNRDAVKADFEMCFPLVSEHGLIAMHDTFPATPEDATPPWCGDAWVFAAELKSREIECLTLPFHPGLTIVRKSLQHLAWTPAPEKVA